MHALLPARSPATISGTPRYSRKRVYRIKFTAASQYGTAVQAFTLT